MMTRLATVLVVLAAASQVAAAQAAPATKAPAAQEQPGLFTRIKRMVGLEKAPETKTAPVTARDTTKPAASQATKGTTTKAGDTKAPATKSVPTKGAPTKGAAPAQPQGAQATKGGASAPTTKAADTKAPPGKAADTKAAPGTKAAPPTGTKQGGLTVAPEVAAERVPVILREVYDYDAEGRRDPFFSLLTTSELRPALVDLRLTGVILDPTGRRSVAIMRDVKDNTQYRVTTGMTLGRMRVALIKARSVIFSIEEFGLNRQDSLVLGDTTKARAR